MSSKTSSWLTTALDAQTEALTAKTEATKNHEAALAEANDLNEAWQEANLIAKRAKLAHDEAQLFELEAEAARSRLMKASSQMHLIGEYQRAAKEYATAEAARVSPGRLKELGGNAVDAELAAGKIKAKEVVAWREAQTHSYALHAANCKLEAAENRLSEIRANQKKVR